MDDSQRDVHVRHSSKQTEGNRKLPLFFPLLVIFVLSQNEIHDKIDGKGTSNRTNSAKNNNLDNEISRNTRVGRKYEEFQVFPGNAFISCVVIFTGSSIIPSVFFSLYHV